MDYASEIKSMVSTPELLAFYGFKRDRAGFVCCPFHGEKTPSMKVYDGARGFHCFGGCGAHGDIVDFVQRYFKLSFKDAIAKINDDFHLGLPLGRSDPKQYAAARAAAEERRRQLQSINRERERLNTAYNKALTEWAELDRQRRENAPQGESDVPNALFLEALQIIDAAAYRLNQAESELYLFESKHKEGGGV